MVQWASFFVVQTDGTSLLRRDTLIIGSVAFVSGVCIGVYATSWMPWHIRQAEVNNEIIRRLSILESILNAVKLCQGNVLKSLVPTEVRRHDPFTRLLSDQGSISEEEESEAIFADAVSVMDDAMSRNSSEASEVVRRFPSSLDSLLETMDNLLISTNPKDFIIAYNMGQTHYDKYKTECEFLWRHAHASILSVDTEGMNLLEKQQRLQKAMELLQVALQLDPGCAKAHKWLAVVFGRIGQAADAKTRVLNGFMFKRHIDESLRLDSSDPGAYYLQGRWCFEVQKLTWLEKKLAATFVATPPTSTIEEALDAFLKADRLYRGSSLSTRLYVAKCYIAKGEYSEAARWLKLAQTTPMKATADDADAAKETRELWPKYVAYCPPDTLEEETF